MCVWRELFPPPSALFPRHVTQLRREAQAVGPEATQTEKYSSYSNGCGRWAAGMISFSRL
jgi:hypothetical protein